MKKNNYFFSPTKGMISFKEVVKEIVSYIKEKPEKIYEVIVGCDSHSSEEPFFPLAIVVLRKGMGGRFFLKKISYPQKKFFHWKTRVLQEVIISCEAALNLKEELIKELLESDINWQFRYIHADIGENGATKELIKEVVGLIRGNGFEPKIKPDSFVSSCVADRFC